MPFKVLPPLLQLFESYIFLALPFHEPDHPSHLPTARLGTVQHKTGLRYLEYFGKISWCGPPFVHCISRVRVVHLLGGFESCHPLIACGISVAPFLISSIETFKCYLGEDLVLINGNGFSPTLLQKANLSLDTLINSIITIT
jgi:hypothetical protein